MVRRTLLGSAVVLWIAIPHAQRGSGDVEYLSIPAGTFTMGCVSGDEQCQPHERPAHRVTLSRAYRMSRTEITVAAFRQFASATGFRTRAHQAGRGRAYRLDIQAWDWVPGLTFETPLDPTVTANDRWPAVQIAWSDAQAYCEWTGGRLPTEAEWERAARGGREGDRFPWGNEPTPRVDGVVVANGPDETMHRRYSRWAYFAGFDDGVETAAPVGSYAANPYGMHDIAGNVWEWTADWYAAEAYARGDTIDPKGPDSGTAHVARGGAWAYAPEQHRSSERGYAETGFWTMTFGFRCARDS